MSVSLVILAAGKGTRMQSSLPKVLHPLGGKPLIQHVLDTARQLHPQDLRLVVGHGQAQLRQALIGQDLLWVEQAQQRGTGHAVQLALEPLIADNSPVLVLYGDVPLIQTGTLRLLLKLAEQGHLALLTQQLDNPTGYGRILRDAKGEVLGIVEEKDASPTQKAIREVNTGILAARAGLLKRWLEQIRPNNAQAELYLTDVVALARADRTPIEALSAPTDWEVAGINDRVQLAQLERQYQRLQAEALMRAGVTLADPARIDIRGELQAGSDSFIDVGCVFEGQVRIGQNCRIGPYCHLKDVTLADGVELKSHSVLEQARVGSAAIVGPFARLRPGTELAERVHIGNFVEVKNGKLGAGSKANHLTYIGDAQIGRDCNIGAGTITCNYDGANKFQTRIEDNVFVGSDTQLIAPVTIGAGATIGAGTTVAQDVPPNQLCVGRVRQRHIAGWQRPQKKQS